MSDKLALQIKEAQRILLLHEQATAEFRAGLAERSEAEVKYDECLLSHLRKGKSFKIALRKANKKFPEEALNPGPADVEDAEQHYRFFLRMTELDEKCHTIESRLGLVQESDRKIADIDGQISAEIQKMAKGTIIPEPAEDSTAVS